MVLEQNLEEKTQSKQSTKKRTLKPIDVVGMVVLAAVILCLVFIPGQFAGVLDAMILRLQGIIPLFLTGTVGMAILIGCIVGRVLERLGFTDALIRLFLPVTRLIRINPTIMIPAVYNIIGDQQAGSKITVGSLLKGNCTVDEMKISIATMVQAPNNFSTLMLAILCLSRGGIAVGPVLLLGIILPLLITPAILRTFVWRDVKYIPFHDLPSFTPKSSPLDTLFESAKEGARLLFLVVIPSVAVIFSIIGALDYVGIWPHFMNFLSMICAWLHIDPELGVQILFVSPTMAAATLSETVANYPVMIVIGTVLLACSGLPAASIIGQLPPIWSEESGNRIKSRQVIQAGLVGILFKFVYCFIAAAILSRFY